MMSLRDDILGCKDARLKEMEIPEWDTTIYLRSWTVAERYNWSALATKSDGDPKSAAKCLAMATVYSVADSDGKQVFSEKDVEALTGKSGEVLQRILEVSL